MKITKKYKILYYNEFYCEVKEERFTVLFSDAMRDRINSWNYENYKETDYHIGIVVNFERKDDIITINPIFKILNEDQLSDDSYKTENTIHVSEWYVDHFILT